jgi:hypothetical protein
MISPGERDTSITVCISRGGDGGFSSRLLIFFFVHLTFIRSDVLSDTALLQRREGV